LPTGRASMSRRRHPKKEIETALRYSEGRGWSVKPKPSGHAWGEIRCPSGARGGCRVSVWSSPRDPGNHAKHLMRRVDACPH
jgi:hypothetical protein